MEPMYKRVELDETHPSYSEAAAGELKKYWHQIHTETSTTRFGHHLPRINQRHILTGAVLNVFKDIFTYIRRNRENAKFVMRVTSDEGETHVGLGLPPADVGTIVEHCKLRSEKEQQEHAAGGKGKAKAG